MTIKQLENGDYKVENQYARLVTEDGNLSAQSTISEVFEIGSHDWRGIGNIDDSGYKIREKYQDLDADKKFQISIKKHEENVDCIAGDILKGNKKPFECSQFGKKCIPENPLGAPMVSTEGACAAYYHFSHNLFENQP
jgi:hydrogenase expression/formation protein HypD